MEDSESIEEIQQNDSNINRNIQNELNPIFTFILNTVLNTNTDQVKNLNDSILYLKQIKEAEKIIEDEQAIAALIDINELYRKNRDKIQIIIESKFQIILKDLFAYFYTHLSTYVDENNFDIELENTNAKFTTFHLVSDLAEILVTSSKEFASVFHMISGTKIFLSFFNNKNLMNYLIKSFTNSDPFIKERKMNYCKAIASILNCLLHLKMNRNQSFRDLDAHTILTSFSNSLKFDNCELIIRSHFVLASILTCKQIQSLENIDFTVLILEKTVQMFAQACQKKVKYNSYQFDLFYDNEMRSFEITTNNSPSIFIVIILSVLEAFLATDEIKYRVFLNLKNSLFILLSQGDAVEKYISLCLLFNFATDEVLNEKLKQNTNILILIDQLLAQTNIDESVFSIGLCLKNLLNINNLCDGYKRLPTNRTEQTDTSRSLNINLEMINKSKVLISFHEINELISMRIRLELQHRGFQVELIRRKKITDTQIDIRNIISSIESCDYMIICVSSSFEFEKICQFETIYANRLGKRIIPLNVQAKYVPDYWLENLIDNKKMIQISLSTIKSDINLVCKELDKDLNSSLNNQISLSNNKLNKNKSKTCHVL